jgi:small-conductance mechanosensitive channel
MNARYHVMSKGSIVVAGGAEILTLLTDPRWGTVMALVGGSIFAAVGFVINQWQRIVRARIENERLIMEEKIRQDERLNQARIANIKYEEENLKGTMAEQLRKMTAQIEEQNASLAAARVSLHKMNDKAQADEMRRLEEITLLKDELVAARQEVHQLRDQNRVLTEQVFAMRAQLEHNTAVVEKTGEKMGAMGIQVQANAEAIAKTQDDLQKNAG